MSLEKVIFGFFVLLAATLNFGFFIGDLSEPSLHNVYELFAAVVVSLIATVLKFGDRTQIGAVHLATSLVADLQLFAVHAQDAAMRILTPLMIAAWKPAGRPRRSKGRPARTWPGRWRRPPERHTRPRAR